jgi:pantetheine-phosphate adenylyltransferase
MTTDRAARAFLGGTFDHLHDGHKHFLRAAAQRAHSLTIGIVSDDFLITMRKPWPLSLEPFIDRLLHVQEFLRAEGVSDFQTFPLEDPLGPVRGLEEPALLVASDETATTMANWNQSRMHAVGWQHELCIVPLLYDSAHRHRLSSSMIRHGQCDRHGETYLGELERPIWITQDMREAIRALQMKRMDRFPKTAKMRPRGSEYLTRNQLPLRSFRCVVGDVSLATALDNHIAFDLGVFDGKTRRLPTTVLQSHSIEPNLQFANQAGTISPTLFAHCKQWWLTQNALPHITGVAQQAFWQVDGEEDMVAVVLAMMAPLGTEVYFGLPGENLGCVIVDEAIKMTIRTIIMGHMQ